MPWCGTICYLSAKISATELNSEVIQTRYCMFPISSEEKVTQPYLYTLQIVIVKKKTA